MVLASQIGLLFSLLGLAQQDFRERLISITWFAAFGILVIVGWHFGYFQISLQEVIGNISFLILCLSGLSIYHRIRHGSFLGFIDHSFGLGDLLFLGLLAVVLPFDDFVLFFVASSIIVLFASLAFQLFNKTTNFTIPFAGGQAILLGIYFICKWWISIDLLAFEILMI